MTTSRVLDVDSTPFLDRVPAESRQAILANSRRVRYPAGTFVYQPPDPRRPEVLESGFLRVFVSSTEGRQAAIRYVHAGQVLGVLRVLDAPYEGSAHALVDSVGLRLDSDIFLTRAQEDLAVAGALIDELAVGYARTTQIVALHAFGSIKQKVAFDLLDRAGQGQLANGQLEAKVTQQDVADGIGSVRRVVARALAELRRGGLIDSTPRRIRILDPEGLDVVAYSGLLSGP
jgi:CRP/FNR family transcriptional regulator